MVARKGETITHQAVALWRERHAAELAEARAEIDRQVTDYAIADKVNRVAVNDMLRNLLLQVRDDRANGKQGMETGLVVRREKALGAGRNMTIVEEFEIDPALITLIDRLHSSTADELGQRPKAASLDMSDRRTYVLQLVTKDAGVDLG